MKMNSSPALPVDTFSLSEGHDGENVEGFEDFDRMLNEEWERQRLIEEEYKKRITALMEAKQNILRQRLLRERTGRRFVLRFSSEDSTEAELKTTEVKDKNEIIVHTDANEMNDVEMSTCV